MGVESDFHLGNRGIVLLVAGAFAVGAVVTAAVGGGRPSSGRNVPSGYRQAGASRIISENVRCGDDTCTGTFTARIAAREPKVYRLLKKYFNYDLRSGKNVRIISQSKTEKTIELRYLLPNGRVLVTTLVCNFFPEQGRIQFQVGSGSLETYEEYDLSADGNGTIMRFRKSDKVLRSAAPLSLPLIQAEMPRAFGAQFASMLEALHLPAKNETNTASEKNSTSAPPFHR